MERRTNGWKSLNGISWNLIVGEVLVVVVGGGLLLSFVETILG
jgi:hypothetical protein